MDAGSLTITLKLDSDEAVKLAGMAKEIAKTAETLERQSAEFVQAVAKAYEKPSFLEA